MPIVVYITAMITQHIHGFHEHTMQWKKDRENATEEENLLDGDKPKQNRKNSLV